LKKCFAGESRDQIRQIKEPVRTHIPEIRQWFLSQPSGLKGATPSWRIWAVKARMTSSTGC